MVVGLAGCGWASQSHVRSPGSTPRAEAWGVGSLFAHFLKINGAVQPSENAHRIVAVAAAVHSWRPSSAGLVSSAVSLLMLVFEALCTHRKHWLGVAL